MCILLLFILSIINNYRYNKTIKIKKNIKWKNLKNNTQCALNSIAENKFGYFKYNSLFEHPYLIDYLTDFDVVCSYILVTINTMFIILKHQIF